ncbi:N-terminal nucleophile aminohydrolase [Rhizophagus irregularis]|uniref:Proteasome subunit beta n=2 Tax=Rhizophagus irregularis TaxID=588596 RepID=A0A2I1ESJ7_9GLOM|nr:nucleophile aminohydrolase [Rhizophagus irregularis DAOM 181602=DAOM 197198]PKC05235.1 N-terminal nucleophile aminohydrolase [Rhizophagus irregularis]PKC69250.1 N-terminal nucleophile aminohydrolase [Rhizophagus irregularis]PKK67079.1 N-terminal nucleophile aminohydrolase [Rhizophagus irregularis]PKY25113.1 N-terminal nucleophile aminohydrolase [Rhizophagus irregularis]POG60205.1 nucleophile aminohydrolase [Rhizophagus irregularis DAOM 181602=DAOM 197198]|eukprot:XP_025167071.1 nucleophile aminohydrolase [Rhizophagus irregularis DAOM 181602=DAOM 197198]
MNPVTLYNNDIFTNVPVEAPVERNFYPYADNGGTSLGIAGADFCLMASDTRKSSGYSIHSRYSPKAFKLTEKAVLATNGFAADGLALTKRLGQKLEWYKHAHDKEMSTPALAQMLANTLYYKRFFPYYTFNLLGGIDEQGRGVLYSFDPVGSMGTEVCRAGGSSAALIQPFLDNQVALKNQQGVQQTPLSLEAAIRITKDSFTSATERDIYTGDYLEIFIIRQEGTTIERIDLKKD